MRFGQKLELAERGKAKQSQRRGSAVVVGRMQKLVVMADRIRVLPADFGQTRVFAAIGQKNWVALGFQTVTAWLS